MSTLAGCGSWGQASGDRADADERVGQHAALHSDFLGRHDGGASGQLRNIRLERRRETHRVRVSRGENNTESFTTTFGLSFGLVISFGLPYSVMLSIILVHTLWLGADIIGVAFPAKEHDALIGVNTPASSVYNDDYHCIHMGCGLDEKV